MYDEAYDAVLRKIKKAKRQQKSLDLRGLGLKALPPEIARLEHLETVWLQDNQLLRCLPK